MTITADTREERIRLARIHKRAMAEAAIDGERTGSVAALVEFERAVGPDHFLALLDRMEQIEESDNLGRVAIEELSAALARTEDSLADCRANR
jgi:hypothetical protein